VGKRCSKRNAVIGLNEEKASDSSFEYNPASFENLFDQDEQTRKRQLKAIQKKIVLKMDDVKDVIGVLDSEKQIVLIETKKNSEKFKAISKENKIGVFIGKPSDYNQFMNENDGKYMKFFVV